MLKKWFGKKDNKDDESSPAAAPESEAPVPSDESAANTAESRADADDQAPVEARASEEKSKKPSMWARLKQGLTKTRAGLSSIFTGRKLDDEFVDALEAQLFAADFGPATVDELIDGENGVRQAWKSKEIETSEQVREFLKTKLKDLLKKRDSTLLLTDATPNVILVAGVNGTGKTTSIAKIAHRLRSEGKTVVLAAADTFRAAAVEQLTIWSERLGVEIVTGKQNADPASVAFQGAEHALASNADVLIVDTAGRLHTQQNLMRELEKIRNVLGKKIPGAPHESLLVLDATTGQNAMNQATSFTEAADVTGIVLTKLDGTAKGGILITINNLLEIPVKFVGVGEQIEDLQEFDPDSFVDALFDAE